MEPKREGLIDADQQTGQAKDCEAWTWDMAMRSGRWIRLVAQCVGLVLVVVGCATTADERLIETRIDRVVAGQGSGWTCVRAFGVDCWLAGRPDGTVVVMGHATNQWADLARAELVFAMANAARRADAEFAAFSEKADAGGLLESAGPDSEYIVWGRYGKVRRIEVARAEPPGSQTGGEGIDAEHVVEKRSDGAEMWEAMDE